MRPFVIHDPRFASLVIGHALLDKLWTGMRWAEGPAYFPAGRYLVWSDIPNDRLMRLDETDGSVSVFREPCNNANGNTTDHEGRLVTCEHRGRRVTRTEHDGSITVLADRFEGKRLNSPNDVVVKSDRSIWFTDPTYGIDSDYEGDKADSEIGASNVYRIDPAQRRGHRRRARPGEAERAGVSRRTRRSSTSPTPGARMCPGCRGRSPRMTVNADGVSVSDPKTFATCQEGAFDGFRCDSAGNVWTSAGRNVFCYAPDGTHLGTIPIGELVANVCFGGPKRNRLYICGQTSLYAIYVKARAA